MIAVKKWQTMGAATPQEPHPARMRALQAYCQRLGQTEEEIDQAMRAAMDAETWMNNVYVATVIRNVATGEGWPEMAQLSIRRIDRKVIHNWRELQRVKADIFGVDCEAVELYPAEHRVVDTANSYHLWVFTKAGVMFPFGWSTGLKADDGAFEGQQAPGA